MIRGISVRRQAFRLLAMTVMGIVVPCRESLAIEPTHRAQAPAVGSGAPAGAPLEKKLIAIAGFENRSTYSADKLWETSAEFLTSELIKRRHFRVVEWARMKMLFDWDALGTTDLVKTPEARTKAQQILLCEYFVSGAITRFEVTTRGKVGALSKKKEIQTTVRVDLAMVDARTGEYVSSGTGQASMAQTIRSGFSGGQTGGWDPATATAALEQAVASAVTQLILQFGETGAK